ncbi:type VI secretion system-associated protein TagO [Vreelandella titanicae]|uniref:type VI secretion system-associated protein TagO n=1 Tax=Vreelandella titanicae TaxID=664683 RepID=UPI0040446523
MDNWKVIGTIAAGVLILGWLLNDDAEDTESATNASSVVSTSEADEASSAEPETSQPEEEPPAPTPPPEPRSPWQVSEEVSPMDDSKNVYLSTRANEALPGRYGRSVARPTLYVRCVENTTALILNMDGHFMASSDYHTWGHVDMRIDDGQAFTKSMRESTNNKALGLWNGGTSIPVIRQMFGADQLTMRATPHSESPMTMTFDITGLEEEIAPLREACHW